MPQIAPTAIFASWSGWALVAGAAAVFMTAVWSGAGADETAMSPAEPVVSQSAIGISAQIRQVVIAGSEVEAKPIEDRRAPLVVRVLATFRHGSDFRYDLEYYGLERGRHDLRDYLRRKDGGSMISAQPLLVEISSRLPPGQILPSPASPTELPHVGGYSTVMVCGIGLWMLATIWYFLGRRRQRATASLVERVPTLAERLRPLLVDAIAGRLSPAGQAELERLLVGYWHQRLNLADADPVAALATIRSHAEAGLLLRQVEDWLHKPGGAGAVDIAPILRPYQELLDRPSDSAGAGEKTSHGLAHAATLPTLNSHRA